MKATSCLALIGFLCCFSGCSGNAKTPTGTTRTESTSNGSAATVPGSDYQPNEASHVVTIQPGIGAEKEAQEALILAEPGDTIEFAEGTFEFKGTLSLSGIAGITIRGKGIDKTILNFTGQRSGSGGEGLKIKGDRFTIVDLTLQNAPGDAIKVEDSKRVTFRRIKTTWTRGPSEQNGAYGIYPVLCSDVLIEYCVAECASDAGIYVGQTERAIIRHNRAERNVAGIEIENTVGADVYENDAINNTGGLLVFSLPGLKQKNGSHCRVFKNRLNENNHPNFATAGAIVAMVPAGTGLMIMANDRVEIFENEVLGNSTTNCAIVSFLSAQRKFDDEAYDPFPEGISIHDNRFADGGKNPQGTIGKLFEQVAGLPMPDIITDGINNSDRLIEGKLPEKDRLLISNNIGASFADLGMAALLQGGKPEVSRDMGPHTGKRESLNAIVIPGVE